MLTYQTLAHSASALALASALVATPTFAQSIETAERFEGRSHYTATDPQFNTRFSALEQKGVQKTADERALGACAAAGYLHCVLASSILTQCNVFDSYATIACYGSSIALGYGGVAR